MIFRNHFRSTFKLIWDKTKTHDNISNTEVSKYISKPHLVKTYKSHFENHDFTYSTMNLQDHLHLILRVGLRERLDKRMQHISLCSLLSFILFRIHTHAIYHFSNFHLVSYQMKLNNHKQFLYQSFFIPFSYHDTQNQV